MRSARFSVRSSDDDADNADRETLLSTAFIYALAAVLTVSGVVAYLLELNFGLDLSIKPSHSLNAVEQRTLDE